jgi:hypothetical protein
MAESILDIGKVTLWMNSEYILGKMEECTKVSTRRIKSMDLVYIHGQMVDSTLANGKMGSNMGKVSIRMYSK